jgi:hypothetical protein
MLSKGEKIFLITRRLFNEDIRRHFLGEIQEVSGGAIRVQGYVFVYDASNNEYVKRDDVRTRLFSTIDANLVINILPGEVNLTDVHYQVDKNNHLVLTDG